MLKAVKFAAVLVILLSRPALAEMNGALRIAVLNDMSSVYADFQGPGRCWRPRSLSRTSQSNQSVKSRSFPPTTRTSLMWVLASRAVGLTLRASI